MNFLLDENFPKAVIPILEKSGHQVLDYRLIGCEGDYDDLVIKAAIENEAVLLTTDRDFFHTYAQLYPEHFGIVVVALKKPNRLAITEKIEWLLNYIREEDYTGRAFQLRVASWVAFPPLP